ncbi:hypothetical protein EW145_g5480 [Phellinidium pouzarii]|uniref:RCC1-like domain-containing protein n=1 Tax=Phellinidium pouzarii TaxID=167371 RepID=A0A4S4L018_9AGAM|nr:hypothetical protein EW145_g5480 [Phellinidium pouzarii]
MNKLPLPASHPRPSRQLFICGSGEFGLLGMGTDVIGELSEPHPHAWVETAVQSNLLGMEEGAGIEQACAGGMHSLIIDEAGKVWSWGVNDNGALGRQIFGVSDPDAPGQLIDSDILESQPMLVRNLVGDGFRAVQIAVGDSVSVALSDEGLIRAWGCFRSGDGPLGFDYKAVHKEPQLYPMALELPTESRCVQVVCGGDHVLALTQEGTVFSWGNGEHAELGRKLIERRKRNGLIPTRLPLRRIIYVAAGSYHSFAIDEDGNVFAWGLNAYRQTSIFSTESENEDDDIVWVPTEVRAFAPEILGRGRRVVQICGGEHHSIFLLNDGSVFGCGRCDGFELGLARDHPNIRALEEAGSSDSSLSGKSTSGAFTYIATPTLIRFPPPPTPQDPDPPLAPANVRSVPNPIAHITTSARHNIAVSRTGHAYAWGLGQMSELGLGESVSQQQTPRRVRCREFDELRLDGLGWKWVVEDAAAGGQHSLFVVRMTE